MKLHADQFEVLLRLEREVRDLKAAMKAVEAQLAAVIALTTTQNDELNARISFQRRPRP